MSRRWFVPTITLLALLAGLEGWGAWRRSRELTAQLAFSQRRLAFFEGEVERLRRQAQDQQLAAAVADQGKRRHEIEKAVESLRELPFLHPVSYREIPRTELPAILRAKLGQQIPDQEFTHTAVALAALGLIPAGTDLKKTYLGLLGEQVGAFYDQHSAELFTFAGQDLASAQNQVILAHELTHALEDQHFHLARLPLETKGDDDRALAASALAEGDATLVMNQYMVGNLNAAAVRDSLLATVATDVHQLAAAPRFLRETLLFPYLRGLEFCQALYDAGGWPELARAFAHPPASTSMILHPDRYLAAPEAEPAAVNLPVAAVLGQPVIDDNVLGEFGLRQWLLIALKDELRSTALAAGWAGDHYLAYQEADVASYVWATVWRTPDAASAFAAAASAALAAGAVPAPASSQGGPVWRRGARCATLSLDLTQRRVLIIDAGSVKWFDALRSRFDRATSRPPAATPDAHDH